MAIVDVAYGLLIYLAVPLTLLGYWLTMRDARIGAGVTGFVLGVGIGLPMGKGAGLAVGAVVGALGVAVAHLDDRLGWAFAAGSTGALLGPFLVGSTGAAGSDGGIGVVAAGAAVALALVVGALAWRFPRGTLLLSTSLHGGLLGLLVFTSEASAGQPFTVDPNPLLATAVISIFVGSMLQPWTAELGSGVPPLLPLTIRKWFDLVPDGGVDEAICPNCGEDVDPTAPYCANCDASLAGIVAPTDGATRPRGAGGVGGGTGGTRASAGAGPGSDDEWTAGTSQARGVPDDAAAVDVPCPECGERPIEEAAKGVGLFGLVILYKWSTRTVVGCHECNRGRLWRLAGKNMLLGWWSITALVNPFAILWNLGRGAVTRGPNQALARHLAESGVDFQYLTDPSEFNPDDHAEHEVLLRGLLRLGTAVMLADGSADKREAKAIRDTALELFPAEDPSRLEVRIEEYSQGTTNAVAVAGGLQETLTQEGRQLALRFAAEVAVADGDVADQEAELLATLADELDLSDGAVEAAIGSGVSTADAPDPAGAI